MVTTRTKNTMNRPGTKDEERPEDLLAPPDLDDGVESLDYWHRRLQQLPWYRVRARREATRMIVRWEQRVRAAILWQQRAPLESRFSAGVLVARIRLARWVGRLRVAVLTTVSVVVLLTILVAATAVLLLHAG